MEHSPLSPRRQTRPIRRAIAMGVPAPSSRPAEPSRSEIPAVLSPRRNAPWPGLEEVTRETAVRVKPLESPSTNDCVVVIYSGDPLLRGKRFLLDNPAGLKIGRSTTNDLSIEVDSVSRHHAMLQRRGNSTWIVDCGSTNGTMVNDAMIAGEYPLADGDRIQVGTAILKFLSGSDVEAHYYEEIYKMTILDALTGAHQKRYLVEALEREVVRSKRAQRPLSLMLIDLDHFKRVNDTYGHLAGDFVLKDVARRMQEAVRREDIFARYGGEEFCLVLPETGLEGAREMARELRRRIDEHTIRIQGKHVHVTISIGVAALDRNEDTGGCLVKRADGHLYAAKAGGRNLVCG
jgi:diguanylate cyclase (GGDEF)-like protein